MAKTRYIAVDIGASSGRLIVGELEENILSTKEIYRFANGPVEVTGTLYWDILNLYREVLNGLQKYVQLYGPDADGIGIDTWGLDFGLLDKNGKLLQNPVCYRDKRTLGLEDKISKTIAFEHIFKTTGLSVQPFYTLGQFVAINTESSHIFDMAETFLMIPDLLAYFLTGRKSCEKSNAISTQLYDPRKAQWSDEIFKAFDLPQSIMPEIIDSGTVLGQLNEDAKKSTGLKSGIVIAPCTHDTPSAVAAVPGQGDDWAFISCGTWSIVGAMNEDVVTTKDAYKAGLINEITVDGFFTCRNIMGLWLLQQMQKSFAKKGDDYSYDQMVKLALEDKSDVVLINPDDKLFIFPDDMCEAIREFCKRTDQPVPKTPGHFIRCVTESLALSHKHVIDQLTNVLGREFKCINIVGGGSLNSLLCQLTADFTGLKVYAGPVEATIIGNLLTQAFALGHISSVEQIRQISRDSAPLKRYEPKSVPKLNELYNMYLKLL